MVPCSSACVSVRPVLYPERFVPEKRPEMVWVVLQEDEVIPLTSPGVRSDSLVGTLAGLNEPFAVPLTFVRVLRARQFDPARTAALAALAGLASGTLVYLLTRPGGGSSCWVSPYGETYC